MPERFVRKMEDHRRKMMTDAEMKTTVQQWKARGQRVVFTNGCFDILHPGHVRYLFSAKALGNRLVVGVNSDRSVVMIKGPHRPIMSEEGRSELVAALGCVDGVVLFDEDTPLRLIETLVPDVLVKGEDWAEEDIVGADVVRRAGGEVRRIAFVKGYSTTHIIEKIRTGR